MQPKISKFLPKRRRELEQCIVSVSEREENTSEGECETGGDTVTTDEDSGSEDDDYGDTEEERNEVEDVESEESDSPTFKVAKKWSSRFMRHDGGSVALHFKTSMIFMKLFCYASKLLLKDVRANCFYASLLRMRVPRHASSARAKY